MQISIRLNRCMLKDRLRQPPKLPLVQGPLAGYTHAAFRRQVWRWGNPMWAVSEMIPANIIVQNPTLGAYRLYKHPDEGPLVYQLSGNCATTVSAAADYLITHYPADGIDLNAGCPKKKIRKKGCGSALLDHPEQMHELVTHLRPYTPFLSVKIRIDPDDHGKTHDIIAAIQAGGADALIIHGRSWQDSDATPCDWDCVAALIEHTKLPTFINGNLTDGTDIKQLLKHTGALGAMIARGSCGRPWLIGQIQQSNPLDFAACQDSLIQHLLDTEALVGSQRAFLQSQSLLRYYERHIPELKSLPWRDCSSLDERLLLIERLGLSRNTQ